jgi:penicillin V acylase-like amidase (Ntn superfamily)
MKQLAIAVFSLLAISFNSSLSVACTSFAVYSNNTVYGMNFDYKPNLLQIFAISSEIQGKVFHLKPFGFGEVAGMNMQGLFASCQGLIPEEKPPAARSKDQISTWIFHKMALSRFEQVPQVKDLLNNK